MQISISDLNLYLQCPRAYKLREIDGVEIQRKPLSFCRTAAIRKILTLLHAGDKQPSDLCKQEIESICDQVWEKEIVDSKIDREDLRTVVVQEKPATKTKPATPAVTKGERVLKNIKTWCFEYSREETDAQVLYTNVYFQSVIGDVTFVGYIDLVRRVPELGIQALCLNTASQAPGPTYMERDFTLSLYAHALWQGQLYPKYPDLSEEVRLETIPTVGVYYFPHLERYLKKVNGYKKGDRKGNPLLITSRSKESLFDFEYEVLYAVSAIEQEFFPMIPRNPVGCATCHYVCNGKNSVFTAPADTSFDIEEFEKEEKEVTV